MKRLHVIAGLLLIAAGTFGLVHGQIEYTKDSSQISLGPIEFNVKEKESLKIPAWLGVGCIALGSILLVVRGRR